MTMLIVVFRATEETYETHQMRADSQYLFRLRESSWLDVSAERFYDVVRLNGMIRPRSQDAVAVDRKRQLAYFASGSHILILDLSSDSLECVLLLQLALIAVI